MSLFKRRGWYGDPGRHRVTSRGIPSKRVQKKPFAYYRITTRRPIKEKGHYRLFYTSAKHGVLPEDVIKDREETMKVIAMNHDASRWAYNKKTHEYIYLDGRASARKGAPVIKTKRYHKTPRDIKLALKGK
jgi:hypothetical protein